MRLAHGLVIIATIATFTSSVPCTALAAWPHDIVTNVALGNAGTGIDQELAGMLADGAGGAFFVWTDKRNGSEDVYLQRITFAGVVAAGWPVTGLQVCTTASRKLQPQVLGDGAGGVDVVWVDYRAGAASGRVYASRINADGTRAAGFPASGVAVATQTDNEANPRACTDGAGGVLAVWESLYAPTDTDIFGGHVNGAGSLVFSQAFDFTAADCRRPTVAEDGLGGVFALYQDSSSVGIRIYGTHVSGAGTALVAPFKLNFSPYSGTRKNPHITADGSGGFYSVWLDNSNSPTVYEVLPLHYGPAMTPLPTWYDSAPITNGGVGYPEDVSAPLPDGSGGFYLTYNSRVNPNDALLAHIVTGGSAVYGADTGIEPIYGWLAPIVSDGSGGVLLFGGNVSGSPRVQRITASGSIGARWPYGGVQTSAWNPGLPVLASDGNHGVIAGWSDNRLSNAVPSGYAAFAQRIDRFGALGNPEPAIVSVKDAPKDQGGHVRLVWNASYLDSDPGYEIGSYWIWRQTPAAAAGTAVRAGARWATGGAADVAAATAGRLFQPAAAQGYAWEYVATQNANASAQYSYVAATTLDSTGSSNPRTVFMVEAHSSISVGFWDSAPDSGYSVDNIPPVTPAPFTAQYATGTTKLHWNRNLEADLAGYRLYRGTSTAFVPGPGNLVAALPDTGYADVAGSPYVYKLTAVDVHGNESPPAVVTPAGTADVEATAPRVLAFAAPSPNPARESVALRFALPRAAAVRLAVYDASGRLIRELVRGEHAAGEYVEAWDLRNASGREAGAGLYFARFEAEGHSFVRRVAVIR